MPPDPETIPALRVALVGPLPPPSGGMANQTRQLAELLRSEGVQVNVIRTNAPYRPAWIGRVLWLRALFRLIPYAISLWRAIGRSDLVHVMANSGWSWYLFAAPAVWIGRFRHKAVVVNYRGGEAERFFARSWQRVRATLDRADAIIVPSRFLQRVFGDYGQSTLVVPNIIDLERFRRKNESQDVSPDSRPHLIVTRNLEPIYDVATAIRAFAKVRERYPNAHLSVAGTGPERSRLEALIVERDLVSAVTFTGNLDNDEVGQLYASADVFLNPSLADNMPVSVLEALASGVPVVSTNVGGVPYVITDGESAVLVNAGDAEQMAEGALAILNDDQFAANLVDNGLQHVRQFEWSSVREKLFAAYRTALSNPRGRVISHGTSND